MKCKMVVPFLLWISLSTFALAEGDHDESHSQPKTGTGAMTHWMAPADEAAKQNPVPASPDSIQQGKQLFRLNCIPCHGVKADGAGIGANMFHPGPSNLLAMSGTHPDGDFAYKIRNGRRAMPAWINVLDEKQIWHLVNYIQSLHLPEPSLPLQPKAGHSHSAEHKHD